MRFAAWPRAFHRRLATQASLGDRPIAVYLGGKACGIPGRYLVHIVGVEVCSAYVDMLDCVHDRFQPRVAHKRGATRGEIPVRTR